MAQTKQEKETEASSFKNPLQVFASKLTPLRNICLERFFFSERDRMDPCTLLSKVFFKMNIFNAAGFDAEFLVLAAKRIKL